MYLWNYNALAQDLKENKVAESEKVKYLLSIMLYIPTGFIGSNWIPGIYRFLYRMTNEFLAKEAPNVKSLTIFNDFNYITDIATIILIGVTLLLAYEANKQGDGKNFIERFMCLVVPISIRVGFYVLLIFLSALFASLIYFNYQLQHIAIMSGLLKKIRQLSQLQSVSSLMTFISMRVHIFSSVMTIISLIWSALIIRSKIKYIAQK